MGMRLEWQCEGVSGQGAGVGPLTGGVDGRRVRQGDREADGEGGEGAPQSAAEQRDEGAREGAGGGRHRPLRRRHQRRHAPREVARLHADRGDVELQPVVGQVDLGVAAAEGV